MHFDTCEYSVSKHYLSYLVNGDASGLDDTDYEIAKQFEIDHVAPGHIIYDDEDFNNFTACDICGLMADCQDIIVHIPAR